MSLKSIGVFWKRLDRNEEMYLSGSFSTRLDSDVLEALVDALQHRREVHLKVWPNRKRSTDKQAEFELYWNLENKEE